MAKAPKRPARRADTHPVVKAILEATAEAEEGLAARQGNMPTIDIADFDWPLVMTPDHPIAQAIGFERAKAMAELLCNRRSAIAAHRRREIERLSLAGLAVKAIAKELKLAPDYVVQVRRELGLGRFNQRRASAQTIEAIRQLNADGMTDKQISDRLGRDRGYICTLRKRHGIAPVPASKRRR